MSGDSLTLTVAAFFLVMGMIALAAPERIVEYFGITMLTTDGRNEVRAVYGGFGIAMASLLVATVWVSSIRTGVHLTLAAALIGMACGRLISRWIDGTAGRYPWIFFGVEVTLTVLLLTASLYGGNAA
jgi:hypothetical protein